MNSERTSISLLKGLICSIALLSLTLLSCGKSRSPVNSTTSDHKALWASHATPAYVVEQARSCFCPGPHGFIRLTVVGNKIVKGVESESNYPLTIDELKRYKTIDELFEFIDEVEKYQPEIFQVKYDSIFGYPRSVYVDWNREVADEEIGFNTKLVQLFP